jgi:two-component system response regulator MprA/two-component system response regulator PrrA
MEGSDRPVRVLVVEDDQEIAQVLQRSLRMEGYDVKVTDDGTKALDEIQAFVPDLIVLDLGLPGIDGYEVARRLRADGAGAAFLVALTGYALPEDLRRAREAGFDAHLTKPAHPDEIEDVLARAGAGRPPAAE